MQPSSMFHPLAGLTQEEKQAKNVREFTGDGSPYLKVPGLKKVRGVRVGTQEIPLKLKQRVPTNAALTEFAEEEVEMVHLAQGPDGTPILLRNVQSNNGMWQAGVPVYIQGDWDGKKPSQEEQKPEGGDQPQGDKPAGEGAGA